jgi:hypothetical protein
MLEKMIHVTQSMLEKMIHVTQSMLEKMIHVTQSMLEKMIHVTQSMLGKMIHVTQSMLGSDLYIHLLSEVFIRVKHKMKKEIEQIIIKLDEPPQKQTFVKRICSFLVNVMTS